MYHVTQQPCDNNRAGSIIQACGGRLAAAAMALGMSYRFTMWSVATEARVDRGSSGPILRRAVVGRTAGRSIEGYIFVLEHIYLE